MPWHTRIPGTDQLAPCWATFIYFILSWIPNSVEKPIFDSTKQVNTVVSRHCADVDYWYGTGTVERLRVRTGTTVQYDL
jgi:hypothetical protein